jgi:outer membrane protein assembly factor BamD (BamD/ComL family)
VTAKIQKYTMTVIAVLFGLAVLISTGMTTTADGQASVDQEKIIRQLDQVMRALDSGDIAAAAEYLKETAQGLPKGETKAQVELGVAINALQSANSTEIARLHVQIVQDSLQNSTG